ncbi:MAG: M3 family metallopeptidase, partial [Clostridium paraputrificum]
MELNWSLKEIYPSFESEEFKNDLEKLDQSIKSLNTWADEVVCEEGNVRPKLEEYIKRSSKLSELIGRLEAFISLTLSADTKNSEGLRYSDILDSKLTEIVEATTKLERWISNIKDIDIVIKGSEVLKEHEFYIKEIIEKSKYLLSDREESIISKMKNTGSNAWLKLKDNLISNLKVDIEIDGEMKELPLTVVLNMAYDPNGELRRKAYFAEIKSYKKVEEGVAAALNGIKGEVLTVCDLRGYKSPLDMTLVNSRMDEESLDAMLEAMKESMPLFRKYLRRKGELLGYKNGLPFYDM